MGIKTLQKVWQNGSAVQMVIPKNVIIALGIEAGDMVQISWEDVIKVSKENKESMKKDFGNKGKKRKEKRDMEELPEL